MSHFSGLGLVRVSRFETNIFITFVSDFWVQCSKPWTCSSMTLKKKYRYLGKVKRFLCIAAIWHIEITGSQKPTVAQ